MISLDQAKAMDAADPLADFRARFRLPEGVIYLDGNSLGALPEAAAARLTDVVGREWGAGLVRSWNDAGWIDAPARVGAKIARLLGVAADEVIVADSTSVCLFKLVAAAARSRPGAKAIVAEAGNFPTDAHVAQGVAELLGLELRLVDDVGAAIAPEVAAMVLAHVHYRSGRRHDIAAIEALARPAGVPVVWDLSHSIGAVPLSLAADGARLAVGCGYKYLNGGPGAPAFLHVARALWGAMRQPVTGWMGHAAPFAFRDGHEAAAGLGGWLTGTPPILALAALESGVDLMLEADMAAVWAKSIALFDLFAARMAARCPDLVLATPREAARRGSHISFRHEAAYAMVQALIARGVIGDYREPVMARFGLTPLTLGFAEVWQAVEAIAEVMATGAWRDPAFARRG